MGTIISKKRGKKTYYYYQEVYREKLHDEHSGTVRGTGKSKVHTRSIYLGTAEDILRCVQEKKTEGRESGVTGENI
jgi:hypothetical protein